MKTNFSCRKNCITVGLVLVIVLLLIFTKPRIEPCNVAYIPLHGYMTTYIPESEVATSTNASDQTSSEDVTRAIWKAAGDPNMKAIVLEVDSPGGLPIAGQEIEIALKKAGKPTVALVREDGDSAAYLASTGADMIFASIFSDVGDIGITQSYTDNAKQDENNGITFNQLSVGKYKDMFNTDKPLTPDERALAMQELQENYQDIVQIVADNRHMSVDTVTTLADGASMTGTEGVKNGLIDKIGNIDDVRSYLTGKIKRNAIICGIDVGR